MFLVAFCLFGFVIIADSFMAVNGEDKAYGRVTDLSLSRRIRLALVVVGYLVRGYVELPSIVVSPYSPPPPLPPHFAPGLLRNFAVKRGIRDKDALADLMMA